MAGEGEETSVLDARVGRARKVRQWWTTGEGKPADVIGLALSGGGIRSATFSLGLIQALAGAKRGALARIDILSTVSGGGYIGTFLRSLFLPPVARGIGAELTFDEQTDAYVLNREAVAQQAAFASRVLASGPDQKNIEDGRRNPIWWLREHSRYLAPNGPTDYGYAVAYLSRNWVAMLFIFALAVTAAMALPLLAEAVAARHGPGPWLALTWHELAAAPRPCPATRCAVAAARLATRVVPFSPILLLAAAPLVTSAVLSIAYWLSQAMSANEPQPARQRGNLGNGIIYALAGCVLLTGLWLTLAVWPRVPPPLTPMPLILAAGLTWWRRRSSRS